MSEMKEKIIPVTKEQVVKSISVLFLIWFGYGVLDFVFQFSSREFGLLSITFGGSLSLFIIMMASIEYEWDLNPFHKIGYCLRFKE